MDKVRRNNARPAERRSDGDNLGLFVIISSIVSGIIVVTF